MRDSIRALGGMLFWMASVGGCAAVALPAAAGESPAYRPGPLLQSMLEGDLRGVDEIVFAVRVSGRDHWYVNFGYYSCDYGPPAEQTFGTYIDGESLRGYGDGGRLCRLNLRTGRLAYASAGHPAPLLWRQEIGNVAPTDTLRARGTILGVLPEVALEERRVTLQLHDVLALFTDGVTEPIDSNGEEFGEERLAAILRTSHQLPCSEIVARTHAAVWDFAGQRVQFDDYTLVTLKRLGA